MSKQLSTWLIFVAAAATTTVAIAGTPTTRPATTAVARTPLFALQTGPWEAQFREVNGRLMQAKRFAVVDASGKVVVLTLEFAALGPISEGLAAFNDGSQWGFLEPQTGKVVIAAQFDAVSPFSSGRAMVRAERGYRYIDQRGKAVGPAPLLEARPFSDGLAKFSRKFGSFGYLDTEGRVVIPEEPGLWSGDFSEGLAVASRAAPATPPPFPKGYLDKAGKWAIPPRFAEAFPFSEGLACVSDGPNDWYIDRQGKEVFRLPAGMRGGPFRVGRALVYSKQSSRCGFIDRTGKVVIPVTFPATVSNFDPESGLASFREADNRGVPTPGPWGFIDTSGKVVIRPTFWPRRDRVGHIGTTADNRYQVSGPAFEWKGGACGASVPVGQGHARRDVLIDRSGKVLWQAP